LFRQFAAKKYDSSEQRNKLGRPRKAIDMGWGYTRDALRGLKIEIGRSILASILAEAGIELNERTSAPGSSFSGATGTLYACDFFAVETLGVFGTVRYMVFFVIELKSRAVHIAGMRIDPDGAWKMQMDRNLLDPADGFLRNATHLIHDRDPVFTAAWTALLKSGGVKCVRIPAIFGLTSPAIPPPRACFALSHGAFPSRSRRAADRGATRI
jgi:hypothetical protein